METARESVEKIIENIQRVFSGKREIIELALNSLFGGGHLLIVDRPGVGKTTLARALAISIGGETKRIQFTPDLLPTDITGVNIYIQEKGEFRFHKGPVFTNILLADEINRATPRAQSSLLEAMEESQVSVDGVTYPLENPFCVIATQNPIEIQGTFPLPEAQLDRFLLSLSIGYPTREEERRILDDRMERDPISSIGPVMDAKSVEMIKNTIRNKVHISDAVKKYILDITEATRLGDGILIGASPRASLALMTTARTHALFKGRDYVTPEDVKELAAPTLAHRLVLRNTMRMNLDANREAIAAVIDRIPVPRPR